MVGERESEERHKKDWVWREGKKLHEGAET